jgi:hypothetical protein
MIRSTERLLMSAYMQISSVDSRVDSRTTIHCTHSGIALPATIEGKSNTPKSRCFDLFGELPNLFVDCSSPFLAMAKRAVNARQEAAKAKRNAISGKGMSGCFLCRDLDTSLISSFF